MGTPRSLFSDPPGHKVTSSSGRMPDELNHDCVASNVCRLSPSSSFVCRLDLERSIQVTHLQTAITLNKTRHDSHIHVVSTDQL